MSITPFTYGPAPVGESMQVTQERANRRQFMAALDRGEYPVVPAPIAEAAAALHRLDELEAEEIAGVEVWCRTAVNGIAAGKPLAKDFRNAVSKAEKDGQVHQAAQVAIRTVREELHTRLRSIIRDGLDELLEGLAVELGEILAPLDGVPELLDGLNIEDPSAVARASDAQRQALTRLEDAHERYATLRDAQVAAILSTDTSSHGQLRFVTSHLNIDWSSAIPDGLTEFSDVAAQGTIAPSPSLVRFLQVVGREDVWLPSIDELRTAWRELHARPFTRTPVDPIEYRDGQPVARQDGRPLLDDSSSAGAALTVGGAL